MPKITRYGGHSNAGLTEKDAGLTDDTVATAKTAKAKAEVPRFVGELGPELVFPPAEPSDLPFDPADLTVTDVLDLLKGLSDEDKEKVLDAERNGKARYGILGKADAQDN